VKRNLGLWTDWFAPNEPDWLIEIEPVGFVWNRDFETGDRPDELKHFIAEGEPPVLVTHGTSKPSRPGFFSAAIEGCRNLSRRAIVITMYDELVPSRLPKDVRRYKYLPFASILPRMTAIIHHGGIGTLNQAMVAGKPQLVLGYGFDRPDNGARLQRMGLGESLPPSGWRPDDVTASLQRILTAEVADRCRTLSMRYSNEANSAEQVCDVIGQSLQGASIHCI
jgi:rhamnosyltransferase subunit B